MINALEHKHPLQQRKRTTKLPRQRRICDKLLPSQYERREIRDAAEGYIELEMRYRDRRYRRERELRHEAEGSCSAADCEEEVRVLAEGGGDDLAGGGDALGGEELVGAEA